MVRKLGETRHCREYRQVQVSLLRLDGIALRSACAEQCASRLDREAGQRRMASQLIEQAPIVAFARYDLVVNESQVEVD